MPASASSWLRALLDDGVLLALAALVGLVAANSPLGATVRGWWAVPLGGHVASWAWVHPIRWWINDGAMAFFFALVGMEIKEALTVGELASWSRAALPVIAALGGMVMPAVLYLCCARTPATRRGWAIPTATDIAFAIGALRLVRPPPVRTVVVFLTALAIVDDLGGILIIGIGYGGHDRVALPALGVLAGVLGVGVLLHRARVERLWVYVLLGIAAWACLVAARLPPAIAGVLVAALVPGRPPAGTFVPEADPASLPTALPAPLTPLAPPEPTPLARAARLLRPWVLYGILPVFALANACVPLQPLLHAGRAGAAVLGVVLGVVLGLCVGKPLGIIVATRCGERLTGAPLGVPHGELAGLGCLGGIGFTMALVFVDLAFPPGELQEAATGAVLVASFVATLLGLLGCALAARRRTHLAD